MPKLRKPLIGLAIFLGTFIIIAIIYRATYSMGKAVAFEVNDKNLGTRILIATQRSDFKEELVRQLVDSLKSESVYIQVKDISILPEIQAEDWTAILVIHTWEYTKPPREVSMFSARIENVNRTIYFATSGDGGFALQGVDAISGASDHDQMGHYLTQILNKLRPLISEDFVDQSHIVH